MLRISSCPSCYLGSLHKQCFLGHRVTQRIGEPLKSPGLWKGSLGQQLKTLLLGNPAPHPGPSPRSHIPGKKRLVGPAQVSVDILAKGRHTLYWTVSQRLSVKKNRESRERADNQAKTTNIHKQLNTTSTGTGRYNVKLNKCVTLTLLRWVIGRIKYLTMFH